MFAGLIRYSLLSRREFVAGSAAIAANPLLSSGVVGAEPNVVPPVPPPPPPAPPVIQRDLSTAGIDQIKVGWQAETVDCSARVEITGIFNQEVETRVIENALSGIVVSDLPSRSLYQVRVKSVCAPVESEWSAPLALCTTLPQPKGLNAQVLPLGGAANVSWAVVFDRPVLNKDSLRFRLLKRRGSETVLVHEAGADGNLSGNLHDTTFGAGDSYQCEVFGRDLADLTQTMTSPVSDEVRPLLMAVSVPRPPTLQSVPTFSPFGDMLGNWKAF